MTEVLEGGRMIRPPIPRHPAQTSLPRRAGGAGLVEIPGPQWRTGRCAASIANWPLDQHGSAPSKFLTRNSSEPASHVITAPCNRRLGSDV
jgi:hypothetical protein